MSSVFFFTAEAKAKTSIKSRTVPTTEVVVDGWS